MNRVTLAIVLLFGTALALYWQVQLKEASRPAPAAGKLQPDFVATDLNSISFNDEGEPESRVSAAHMEHFDATGLTLFTKPVYTLFPTDGQGEWQLTANTAKLEKSTDTVTLETDVKLKSLNSDEPLRQLTTSYLSLDLATMILTSDQEIQILGNHFHLSGRGLYADLNNEEAKLLSDVKGTYEPK